MHSPNTSFAEGEPASEESHEHEAENTVVDSTQDTHIGNEENMPQEHSSHESAGVGDDVPEHKQEKNLNMHTYMKLQKDHTFTTV